MVYTAAIFGGVGVGALFGSKLFNYGAESAQGEVISAESTQTKEPMQRILQSRLENKLGAYSTKGDFASEDIRVLFARAIAGEASREIQVLKNEGDKRYVQVVSYTILNRANIKEQPIRDSILFVSSRGTYSYSSFSPKDPNFEKIVDPVRYLGQDSWKNCINMSVGALSNKSPNDETLRKVTNYFVTRGNPQIHRTKTEAEKYGIPSWAYEMKDGNFVLKNGKRVARIPLEEMKLSNGKTAFAYSFKEF